MTEALTNNYVNNLNGFYTNSYVAQKTQELENKLKEVQNEQGFLGKSWNCFKEITNLGLSNSDCEKLVDKYNNGEISFEEAVQYIEDFESKQETMSELGANILTGIGAIAYATTALSAGPIGWIAAIAKGAPIGAALKTSIKTLDRATNDKKGDALNAKQITKDAISGALTGTTSAVSSGVGAGIKAGKVGLSILNGAKCGTICGSVSGAASYLVDVAFEDDKEFNSGELLKNTATSAFVSGTVGAVVGGGMYGLSSNVGSETTKTLGQTIIADSTSSTARKGMGQIERNILSI